MEEIKVGDVYNLKGTEKSYTVSNIEVYLSTDIQEDSKKIITLTDNALDYGITIPSSVFWNMFEHKRDIKSKKVYLAGDMLHKSLFEYRKQQKNEIEKIEGLEVYNPSSNDDINSKKTAKKEKLAERIVEQDTVAIENSDVYIIDLPTADAGGRGTNTELGQIFQMKREAINVFNIIGDIYGFWYKDNSTLEDYDFENMHMTPDHIDLCKECLNKISKPVFIFSDDIRWNTSDMKDHMDRVPYSFNAYTYGVALALTNGEGVISWEEVKERLKNL